VFRIALVLLLISSYSVSGQVLSNLKGISSSGNEASRALVRDNDGNTYLSVDIAAYCCAPVKVFGKEYDYFNVGNLIKLDPSGNVVWMQRIGSSLGSLDVGPDGSLWAVDNNYYQNLIKIDRSNGMVMRTVNVDGARHVKVDYSGNVYVGGTNYLAKFTAGGNKEWQIDFSPHNYQEAGLIDLDAEGNVILAGEFMYGVAIGDFLYETNIGYYSTYVAKVSPTGEVKWANFFGDGAGHVNVKDMKVDLGGEVYFTGGFTNNPAFDSTRISSRQEYDFYLCKLDATGKVQWVKNDGSLGNDRGLRLELMNESVYVTSLFSGNTKMDNAQVGFIIGPTITASRFEKKSGRANWIKGFAPTMTNYDYYEPASIVAETENSFLISGTFWGRMDAAGDTLTSEAMDAFAVRLYDTTTVKQSGVALKGKVFTSQNGSCETSQPGIQNIVVKAEPGPYYSMTDADGKYIFKLDPGNYTISQILPKRTGLSINQVCPVGPKQVSIPDFDSKPADVNFGNNVVMTPHLSVDVGATQFRRCFTNSVVVRFCNDGQASANNVEVRVNFPEHVFPVSSSIPWSSKQGNTVIFKFSSLLAQSCNSITIMDSVRCGDESIRNLTQCVSATITPTNPEDTDPLWDNSQISVDSKCLDNGFVRLTMRNLGSGNMKDSAAYKIYTDGNMVYQGRYKLAPQDSLSLQVLANGKTIRLEAFNTPNAPQSMVSVTVEGCGNGTAAISHGFVNAMAQPDDDDEIEMHCSPILDSYDPNDKQVYPSGVTSQHNIIGTEELEYVIRFQNTGTAPAYNVIVRDAIDESLDLSTLNVGASSHNYSFKVEGEGKAELVWTFNNIMLPDSTSDEPGSHGFIKYKIKPLKGLARGTKIRNKAGIYFDFNSPVITNEVFNTIGLPPATPSTVVLQDCNKDQLVEAGEDVSMMVCDAASVAVSGKESAGYGAWKLMEGNGAVNNTSSGYEFSSLSEGKNTFRYTVSYCNKTDIRTVEVNRVITPATPFVEQFYTFCADALSAAALRLNGQNLTWYNDAKLEEQIETGNTFIPSETTVVYVTDQKETCVSEPASVKIIVNPVPGVPTAEAVEACRNENIQLVAAGSNVMWYNKVDDVQPAYTGNVVSTRFTDAGEYTMYVSQALNGCEGERLPVRILVRGFNPDDITIPNIITPNDDGKNDSFMLPVVAMDECAGAFGKVVIYNRFGKTIYSSNKPDFKWNGDVSNGTYFYSMSIGGQKYEGSISVFR
jgi:gliding motility-associated-like protein